ncbi:TetR family transcriptional regulator [Microbacterium invictum]|uniref:AcrR family transcriptional regulator/catechol 2,3-dioxygenase-like lactoylglutathione lyase family enzyme n=1 Tax=Microbacterium invictum TaxID=515415 RepID=A0AA40SMG4_9MICO|nr:MULTISPECIES: TetR family transcriptional regulator [Microbacterium]MBB4138940.1 AcrR family transcriptional regulator/catechol 2,3-dioxygenase-like lactoylglutathione lyase family enzyme [Microbacterium invictum]
MSTAVPRSAAAGAARAGRPRATSRDTLAEAACELFLEQGFDATSIADIATRAGVSRSSFFNYFASKSDILWAALDERIDAFTTRLEADDAEADAAAAVRAALVELGEGFAPDSLALALANAGAMGLEEELERERALRRSRIAAVIAARLRAAGADPVRADVAAAAHAGAVLSAIEAWAHAGAGRVPLAQTLRNGLDAASPTLPGRVQQLRVVARAERFDDALAFYRDVLGLVEQESYQGDGGAQVVILAAGRATLELSNAAQIELIDRVETDGDAPSDDVRIAFEVADTVAMTDRSANGGAAVEATARDTPWRSVNSRLRAPGGLQLTLFQELGPE